jgi:glutathione S-transferase
MVQDDAKHRVLTKGESRLSYLNDQLEGREFLLDRFSVADAYLFTVLNWKIATPVDLSRWPAVSGYYERLAQRPSISRALAEEHTLYKEEIQRHKAA